jgi:hypothetical protein
MSDTEQLVIEIEKLSPAYKQEILDFVDYLKTKQKNQIPETMRLSESSLARDWDTPEEDEAWAGL